MTKKFQNVMMMLQATAHLFLNLIILMLERLHKSSYDMEDLVLRLRHGFVSNVSNLLLVACLQAWPQL